MTSLSSARPSGQTPPASGTLRCHVYRNGARCLVYLSHTGAPDGLELEATVSVGGDWEEANVIHEDAPPYPPEQNGLWLMEYAWRAVTPKDIEDGEASSEWCCVFTAQPTWTLLAPVLEVAP